MKLRIRWYIFSKMRKNSISVNGAGITTTYNRLGVLIPTLGGLIDFNSKLLGMFAGPEMKNTYAFATFFVVL